MRRKERTGFWLVGFLVILSLCFGFVPEASAQQETVTLTPSRGTPGTSVTVTGTGFAPNSRIIVGPGVYATEPVSTREVTTDAQGEFSIQVTIPTSARPDDRWVIMVNPLAERGESILVDFDVVPDDEPEENTYTVQPGDTLTAIARRFDTTLTALIRANPQIENPDLIYVGQQVFIPGQTVGIPVTGQPVYIVQRGDTLSEIAVRFGVPLTDVIEANPDIENPSLIFPGQRVVIPVEESEGNQG